MSVRRHGQHEPGRAVFVGLLCAALLAISSAACAPTVIDKKDYSAFRASHPRSVLIVPVINRSVDVDAPDYFLSTISRPVAERGYYVYPVNMVRGLLDDDGLSEATLVHEGDPTRLAEIFGVESILYITIERWDARYAVLSTTVTVEFSYLLKDGETGNELWRSQERLVYQPNQSSNSGNPLADLIAQALVAALTKALPNYIPLAQQANAAAVVRHYKGIPAGPYHGDYQQDQDRF